jgi:hypothetical protein
MSERENSAWPRTLTAAGTRSTPDANSLPRPCRHGEAEGFDGLEGTIEGEIVPRLLISLAASRRAAAALTAGAPEPSDVAELARLLLAHEPAIASAFIDMIRQRGTPREHICAQLLAPVARHLGQMCEQHGCDYAQLLVGLSRLHALLREVSAAT